ncbi:unnamed protein product, partial [Symbiodinium natans]
PLRAFNSPAPSVGDAPGSKKSRPRKRPDVSGRPVQILHPSKVMRGRSKARWQDVFRVWEREIPKPDFAIHHAAKAVRLLPKVNFRGLPTEEEGSHPVLQHLLRRTQELLQLDNCTVAVSEGISAGRNRREGLCAEDVAAMIRAAESLATRLPQLQKDLVPSLQEKVQAAVTRLSDKDVISILLAGSWESVPEVWAQFLGRLRPDLADSVSMEDLPSLVRLLTGMPDTVAAARGERSNSQSAELLLTLREQVSAVAPMMSLSDLADCFWCLADVNLVTKSLRRAVTERVAQQAPKWRRKDYEPSLWQLVHAYAKMQVKDPAMWKAAARTALREDLATHTNWAIAVLQWSYAQLEDHEDDLGQFRLRLGAEAARRQLSREAPPEWSQDLGEEWLERRVERRPHQIAPRPLRLLQRLSREEDARRAGELRQLVARPGWRELESDVDELDDGEVADIEEFRLFDLTGGLEEPTES